MESSLIGLLTKKIEECKSKKLWKVVSNQ